MTIHNWCCRKTLFKKKQQKNNFGWHLVFLSTSDPMKRTNFHLQNALLSAIPFLANWLFSIFYSRVLDFLLGKKIIKTVHARKTSMAIGKLVIEFKSVSFLTNQSLENIALPPNSADTLLYVSKTYTIELKGLWNSSFLSTLFITVQNVHFFVF